MSDYTEKLSEKLSPKIMALSEQKHLKSIKLGIVSAMPFLTVLGLFIFGINILLALNFSAIENNMNLFLLFYYILNFVFFICMSYGISSNLAFLYELDTIKGGFLGILSSITILSSQYLLHGISNYDLYEFMLLIYVPIIVLSVLVVEIFKLTSRVKIKVNDSQQLPPAAISYINNIIPIFLVVLIIILIAYICSFNWIIILNNITMYIMKFLGSFMGMILIVASTSLFWMFGVHGVSIIGSIARPFWIQMIIINTVNFINGTTSPFIVNEIFYQWFVWIGGSGCTLGLVLLMKYKAKSSYLKSLGKDNLTTSIFNINESIIFGTPISFNIKMMKPFIIVPLVCGSISWFAINSGFITVPFILAPWVLPAPIGAFVSTAGDLRAVLLSFILIIVSVIIYFPFFKKYDEELFDQER